MMNSVQGHTFKHFVEHELGKFPHFMIYAVLEWTLIALLFLDGFLALVSTEFAEFFDLSPPCVLCTRIDHMLMRKRLKCSYNDTICEGHKKELSSLAYCHVHGKLSDLRTMCEGCLLSFATDNRSDPEAYKSMSGVLNKDTEGIFDEEMGDKIESQTNRKDDHMMQGAEKLKNGNEGGMFCSCCGEPMKVKSSEYQKGSAIVRNPTLPRVASRLSQQGPTPSPRAGFASWRTEEARNTLELAQSRFTEPKLLTNNNRTGEEDPANMENPGFKEDAKSTPLPVSTEPEELIDDVVRTPSFLKGNKFFGAGLSESAAASPRWASRLGDSAVSSPRWASRLGESVASPRWAHRGSRKSLLDRVELAPDPVDAIAGNETDPEVIINRLKRQVRQDRKSLISLYMELDEERSASAVAANNAMAMITRLQAEKAAVQMESLQYQRMMEEQAEYDQEALEMLREMLNKREDEIRELESELEIYRDRYGLLQEDIRAHRIQKSMSFSSFTEKSDHDHESPLFSIHATDTEMEMHEHMSDKSSRQSHEEGENIAGKIAEDHKAEDDDESLMDIERDRSYLFGQLRMLESRILHSSTDAWDDERAEEKNNKVLAKEVSELGVKLRSLEEDSRFLKHALLTLKKDRKEGSKILMEIAQNLQKLRQMDHLPAQSQKEAQPAVTQRGKMCYYFRGDQLRPSLSVVESKATAVSTIENEENSNVSM
ncbi:hypothetical protein Cgig2_016802 [Carnegiea gigantea]|uniref:GTD-binding domain-containing protein n=1 Tax=Carnegiea gigantea TaxID=171969 RepID=A0A9Q1GY46_9CARY|nr:hypothetical protein Cgig2_016802 [Carnegiea gigantea]